MKNLLLISLLQFACICSVAFAESATAVINKVSTNGLEENIGQITFTDGKKGLSMAVQLKGLVAGPHGFHIHENPSCDAAMKDGALVAAQAAGAHFDPAASGKHEGPNGQGHAGDLPSLKVAENGTASETLHAARLKVADIVNRSIMIHEGGDNYSDQPAPLGGGGKRIACGVIKAK